MTTQAEPRKKTKLIIIGLVALVVVGLFIAKVVIENQIKSRAMEDLTLYEPYLKLESADVSASLFSASITYKNVVYTMPDVPGLKMVIDSMTQEGIDCDTLLGKAGNITHVAKISSSGFRMFSDKLEQPVLEMGYYEVADMAYPYRDVRAALLAHKNAPPEEQSIFALLKAWAPLFSAAEIKVGPTIMRDFKINLAQVEAFDLFIGTMGSTGLKALDKARDGFDAGLDEAFYKDIKINGSMPDGSEFLGTLEAVNFKGFKYNYKELMAALGKLGDKPDFFDLFLDLMPSLYNYEFSELSADKLLVKASGVDFNLGKIFLGPHSLKQQGPNIASDMRVSFNGMEVLSLEAMGLDKLILSDIIVDFINNPKKYTNDRDFLRQVEANPFMVLDGIRMENLYIKNVESKGIMSMQNWRSDLVIGGRNVDVASKLEKLYVSPMGLRQAAMAGMYLGNSMQDVIGILSMNPNGLKLDSGFNMNIVNSPRSLGFDVNFDMDIQEQGAMDFSINGVTAPPRYSREAYGEPMLSQMSMSVNDFGILNNVFTYLAKQGFSASPEAAREMFIDELNKDMGKEYTSEAEKRVIEGVKQFVSQGGKLSLTFTPIEPMLLDDTDPFDFESFKIGVDYTGPSAPAMP